MAASQQLIETLVHNPGESLTVELKNWFDPKTPDGQAKIVRACIALRNQNGGFLLVGFDDATGEPNTKGAPPDPRKKFHVDLVQSIVSKYASERFEVIVHFVERCGTPFPILEIPSGFRSPVAARRGIPGTENGKPPVEVNRVYVRSLEANGTPSTTEALWKDWPHVVERCFENREADLAGFARRHLSGLDSEGVRALAEVLLSTGGQPGNSGAQATTFLEQSRNRLESVRERHHIKLPRLIEWDVAAVVDPCLSGHRVNRDFLQRLESANPHFTDWPVWSDRIAFLIKTEPPYVFESGWESCHWIHGGGEPGMGYLNFWRVEPEGHFYLLRTFREDLVNPEMILMRRMNRKLLDHLAPIGLVTEAMAVAMAFAKTLGADPQESEVAFAFRWTGLEDRQLSEWIGHGYFSSSDRRCRQDLVKSTICLPLEVPVTSIAPYVEKAMKPFFAAFGGYEIDSNLIERLVHKLVNRESLNRMPSRTL